MIAGCFHEGSGIGNQLHRYVATRVLALDKGYKFMMRQPSLFKGRGFMSLDMGIQFEVPPTEIILHKKFEEKKVVENGIDIRSYDPEYNFIEDNTIIDGEFQDPRYFEHRLPEIREWLKVEPLEMADDVCVINFRGGEYTVYPELYLNQDYWVNAITLMLEKYPAIRFEIHTDDINNARQMLAQFLPVETPFIQDMGLNWRSIRYAKHLILSNSSFGILPALLNEGVKEIITPRYWSRHNIKIWAMPSNWYSAFTYI